MKCYCESNSFLLDKEDKVEQGFYFFVIKMVLINEL